MVVQSAKHAPYSISSKCMELVGGCLLQGGGGVHQALR